MMSTPASRHPLDTDLLDLVEGALSPDAARSVEEHLAGCALCRIKRQRLTNQPPFEFRDLHDVEIPSFGRVETVDVAPETVQPGELWLTGDDEAVMVLIRKALEPEMGVVAAPATFDVEVADNGTVILDASASPLCVPLAIYDGMLSSLPLHALRSRIVPLRDVDLLNLVVGEPGVSRGTALEGPGDPRHEIRQYITDRLTELSPLEEEVNDEIDDQRSVGDGDDFATFLVELQDLRAEGLTVEPCPDLVACPSDWIGLAQILRRYQTLVVLGTPAGLISDSDFVAARSLTLRWHLSAVVVCPRHGETVDVYPPEGLYPGFVLPSGEPGLHPLLAGHGLRDSVLKFFEMRNAWNVPSFSEAGHVERVDVPELLARLARDSAAELESQDVRGEGKPEGWRRAAARGEQLGEVLQSALEGTFDPSNVSALADEDTG